MSESRFSTTSFSTRSSLSPMTAPMSSPPPPPRRGDPKIVEVATVLCGAQLEKVGFLMKRGDVMKSFKRRYCIILQNVLIVLNDEESSSASHVLSLEVSFAETTVVDDQPNTFCFSVRCGMLPPLIFCATSNAEMNEWIRAINTAKFSFLKDKAEEERRARREIQRSAKIELQAETRSRMQTEEENKLILEQLRMLDEFQAGLGTEVSMLRAELNVTKSDLKKTTGSLSESKELAERFKRERDELERRIREMEERHTIEMRNALKKQQHVVIVKEEHSEKFDAQTSTEDLILDGVNDADTPSHASSLLPANASPERAESVPDETDPPTQRRPSEGSTPPRRKSDVTIRAVRRSAGERDAEAEIENVDEESSDEVSESLRNVDAGPSHWLESRAMISIVDEPATDTTADSPPPPHLWKFSPNVTLKNESVLLGKGTLSSIIKSKKLLNDWDLKTCDIAVIPCGAAAGVSQPKKFVIPPTLAKALKHEPEDFSAGGAWCVRLRKLHATVYLRFDSDSTTVAWLKAIFDCRFRMFQVQISAANERRERAEDQLSVKVLEQEVIGQTLTKQQKDIEELQWKLRVMQES